jgi:hypothetical protein
MNGRTFTQADNFSLRQIGFLEKIKGLNQSTWRDSSSSVLVSLPPHSTSLFTISYHFISFAISHPITATGPRRFAGCETETTGIILSEKKYGVLYKWAFYWMQVRGVEQIIFLL